MSKGLISGLQRTMPSSGGRTIQHVIQTDTSINPGNSGSLGSEASPNPPTGSHELLADFCSAMPAVGMSSQNLHPGGSGGSSLRGPSGALDVSSRLGLVTSALKSWLRRASIRLSPIGHRPCGT